MPCIVVTPLAELNVALARWTPSHVLSIQSPPGTAPTLDIGHQQSVTFHDVVDETVPVAGLVRPAEEHAEWIVRFAREWGGDHPLLIHCRFGVSRSPAAALIALAVREPNAAAWELLARLRAAASFVTPNRRLLEAADRSLGRTDLAAAAKRAGRGTETSTGTAFAVDCA